MLCFQYFENPLLAQQSLPCYVCYTGIRLLLQDILFYLLWIDVSIWYIGVSNDQFYFANLS